MKVIDKVAPAKTKNKKKFSRMVWWWDFRKDYNTRKALQKYKKICASCRQRDT